LRAELDQLKRFKDEDDAAERLALYPDDDDEDMDAEAPHWGMDEDEDEDEGMLEAEGYFEDAAAVAMAENEIEVAADTMLDADDYLEDAAAVAMAENEDEVAADTMLLPIHPSSSKASGANPIRTPAKAAPSTQGSTTSAEALPSSRLKPTDPLHLLRPKRSARFNKGGAFHAQEFAKSLGKGSATQADIRRMKRALENDTKK
jgi:hypothetical protein